MLQTVQSENECFSINYTTIKKQGVDTTQSGKGQEEQKKYLLLGPPKSKNLGYFLQHMQKSEFFNYVFWRNCDLKFFPYKTSRDRKARITKGSV